MSVNFEQTSDFSDYGNKAKNLVMLKKVGFNVPDGFVLGASFSDEILKNSDIQKEIEKIKTSTSKDEIFCISEKINAFLDGLLFSNKQIHKIQSWVDDKKLYAVRSSGSLEDLDNFSFAGQYDTFLNVKKEEITDKIKDCIKSMFSVNVLSYIYDNSIDA